ncbi:MAG: GNAT family N-acetyltransferase [Chloroflexi bacterium]|nr:GNAT family N-acetyltransferase [Chloroflexota bacterium]
MASIPIPARGHTHPNLRSLNILRDLPTVADLIELCFASTMDNEGQRYVADMRRAGRDESFLNWATKVAESTSLPLTGYIWEENNRIVGNASLVPFRHNGQRLYLIANVATHPDFRRRSIARALTERAIQHGLDHKAAIWLHVRDDNPGAVLLYSDLGFQERARRTSWKGYADRALQLPQTDIVLGGRASRDWPQQVEWLRRQYPDSLGWYHKWNFSSLQPGLWHWLYMFFVDAGIHQWSALRGGRLEAALAVVPSGREPNALWLAADPRSRPEALTSLLLHARRNLTGHPHLTLDYPSGQADDAIRAAGFSAQRTLIWMEYVGATSQA